jgi:2-polyprenyl-3-methyl-5-hydroxy-6-metoxy-1,4-benzoquinol methylase
MFSYNQKQTKEIKTSNRIIKCFPVAENTDTNIDMSVVESFGDEWTKFHGFDDQDISDISQTYFDIVDETVINKNSVILDAGCGSGRFSKYLANKVAFVEAVDPSSAVLAADKVLENITNVRVTQASIGNLPFEDNSFDFVMSIGVLHHIPNTLQAMKDCVQKLKPNGHFFVYLYYALDNRGPLFKAVYALATVVRKFTAIMPAPIKRILCDIYAIVLYMPFILAGRFLKLIGLKNIASKLPLSFYQTTSFFIIRNDALDRFGTTLEQRFSRKEIIEMMTNCGLTNISVSDKEPLWHAIGKKVC